MKTMRDYSGFRQEISPNSKLGKLLTKTANRIRKYSRAKESNVVRKTVDQWVGDQYGWIYGTFSVQPKTNTISFQGGNSIGMKFEYVYGKLTIEHDDVYMGARKAVALFHNFLHRINCVYDYLDENFTKVGA